MTKVRRFTSRMPSTSKVGSRSASTKARRASLSTSNGRCSRCAISRWYSVVWVLRLHLGAEVGELAMVVAEAAGLRCAAPGAGDHVPASRKRLSRPAGPGIAVDHCPWRAERSQIDEATLGRRQPERWHEEPGEMVAGAVVDRRRQAGRSGPSWSLPRFAGQRFGRRFPETTRYPDRCEPLERRGQSACKIRDQLASSKGAACDSVLIEVSRSTRFARPAQRTM
jgi:hypothetical protein